jgi:NAD(P)H-dependent flavin oxidoreductase YrpB (nitropropane dioxygenase family)
MPLVTRLTKLLNIQIPVVQGGMQWVGYPKLVAAVSNAGGLGVITALSQPNPEALRQAIRETRKMTSKPFAVNITILPSINPPPYEEYARVSVEEGVKIFETAGNNRKDGPPFVVHQRTQLILSGSRTTYQVLQIQWMSSHTQMHYYTTRKVC